MGKRAKKVNALDNIPKVKKRKNKDGKPIFRFFHLERLSGYLCKSNKNAGRKMAFLTNLFLTLAFCAFIVYNYNRITVNENNALYSI